MRVALYAAGIDAPVVDSHGELASSEADTPQAAPPVEWEAPIARLIAALSPCGAATTAPLLISAAVIGDVLKHLDGDDARVALRSSGAVAALSDAIKAAVVYYCVNFIDASAAPLTAASFSGACMLLAAAADNPKNRALLSTSGVLGACLDLLTVSDAQLSLRLAGPTSARVLREVVCAALHIVDASCWKGASVDTRAVVARHAFFSPSSSKGGSEVTAWNVSHRIASAASALRVSSIAELSGADGLLEYLGLCGSLLQSLAVGGSAYDAHLSSASLSSAAVNKKLAVSLVPFEALSAAWGPCGDRPNPVSTLLDATSSLLLRAGSADPGAQLLASVAMQRCVGALANLAQLPALRIHFVDPIPASSRASDAPAAASRLQPLLKLLIAAAATGTAQGAAMAVTEGWLVVLGGAVAALANACLGTPAVSDALCACGAPFALLQLISQQQQQSQLARVGGKQRAGLSADAGTASTVRDIPAVDLVELTARAAALLARISAHPAASAALQDPTQVKAATLALVACSALAPGAANREAVALLQDSLVRVTAGLIAAATPPTFGVFMGAGGLQALVSVMHEQLASLKCITPADSQPTTGIGRFIGLGNACKLLGSLLDEGALLQVPRDTVLASGAIDVLVSSLKLDGGSSSPQAASVRKNASVALARAVRDAACMVRARELRGIEILIQLQMSK